MKVLVIGSKGRKFLRGLKGLKEQIGLATGAKKSEIAYTDECGDACARAQMHRSTLQLVVIASSWSELMLQRLLETLTCSKAKIVALFTNPTRYNQMKRMCAATILACTSALGCFDGVEKAVSEAIAKGKFSEAIVEALTPSLQP